MDILLTGAIGYVGPPVPAALSGAGHTAVTAIVRSESSAAKVKSDTVIALPACAPPT
ncbi:hypothetical protein [Nocardia sp. NPDC049707]|uniref:hypothetical protein n=1 Tax=Nocardia sp. NPDC049707 TaxID=3154735 RepID=UPI003445A247